MTNPAIESSLWTLRLCFTFVMLCAAPVLAADALPSWKKGISAWSGKGYVMPQARASTAGAASPTAAATPRYTVPVDPAVAIAQADAAVGASMGADIAWLESFASSDAVLPSGVKPTITGGAVAQVAAQSRVPQVPRSMLDAPLNLGVVEPGEIDSITRKLESGIPVESALPLEEKVMSWYQYPWTWMTKGWTNHAELGLDGSDGNAKTTSITTGLELKRKTDVYTFAIDVDYRQASNRGVSTQDNGRFNMDYDRLIGDSKWSAFSKLGLEWDKFKAFDLRLNANAGLGYYWLRDDSTTLITRFGSGASKKFGAPDDAWVPEAVFGVEAERQITKRQKIKGKIDYFPAWNDFNKYRLVADASWEILLDGTDNLSLKFSATDRYDSTPQGALPNDIYYSALILYKF